LPPDPVPAPQMTRCRAPGSLRSAPEVKSARPTQNCFRSQKDRSLSLSCRVRAPPMTRRRSPEVDSARRSVPDWFRSWESCCPLPADPVWAPPMARCRAPDSLRSAREAEPRHRFVPDWSHSCLARSLSCPAAWRSAPAEQSGPRLWRRFVPKPAQSSAARSEPRVSVIEAYQLLCTEICLQLRRVSPSQIGYHLAESSNILCCLQLAVKEPHRTA
jgi:hypothetical protein